MLFSSISRWIRVQREKNQTIFQNYVICTGVQAIVPNFDLIEESLSIYIYLFIYVCVVRAAGRDVKLIMENCARETTCVTVVHGHGYGDGNSPRNVFLQFLPFCITICLVSSSIYSTVFLR